MKLMAVLLITASSGYILLDTEQNASASVSPAVLILPTQTMITNTTPEIILRAPLNAPIEISEDSIIYGTGTGNDFSNVSIVLSPLSKGVHMLTAKIIDGSPFTLISLPPIIVDDNHVFDIQDIILVALNIATHAWDFNGNHLSSSPMDNRADIEYLLAKIQPLSHSLPLDDFAVVSAATTSISAIFTFSKPLGATNVILYQKTSESMYSPVSNTNIAADSNTVTVVGLTSETSYQFKLAVIGGTKAGESNTVNVTTAPAAPLYAMDFNGTTDFIEIAHHGVFNSSSFTIEAWVKQDTWGWKRGIVSKYQVHSHPSFTLRSGDVYDNINFQVNDGSEINSDYEFEPNTWYHIAAVYSNNVVTLYINGVLHGQASVNSYMTNSSNLTIGADYVTTGPIRALDGQLGEVRYWTSARTLYEVNTDMHNHALTQTDPNLAGYWNFSDANNPFKDQSLTSGSFNGHNGTPHGTPTRE
jgi:hypothetical protein